MVDVHCRYDMLSLFPPGPILGVEVGTDTGINASELLKSRSDLFLWTVDPFLPTLEYPEKGRTTALKFYEERVRKYVVAGRTKHLRMPSVEAAEVLKGSGAVPDFVYLDGSHQEHEVRKDLEAWLPVLRINGMMAGHDFEAPEVHTPVIQFCKAHRFDLHIINEHGGPDKGSTPGSGYDRWGGWAHPTWWFRNSAVTPPSFDGEAERV